MRLDEAEFAKQELAMQLTKFQARRSRAHSRRLRARRRARRASGRAAWPDGAKARSGEAQWENDDTVSSCRACGREFSLTVRKHHCRKCGKVFCSQCSSFKGAMASSKSAVRLCVLCSQEAM